MRGHSFGIFYMRLSSSAKEQNIIKQIIFSVNNISQHSFEFLAKEKIIASFPKRLQN